MWILTLGLACAWLADAPAEPAWQERARTHLFLEAHENTVAEARYRAVRISDGEQADLGAHPALPMPNWPEHFETVAAASGDAFVVSAPSGGAYALTHRPLSGEPREIASVRRPSALHIARDHLLIGAENTVAAADLRQPSPQASVVLERQDMHGKAFDRFARDGDWLIAVDDIVVPIYADLFRLSADGAPAHLSGLELPGVINGTYDHVLLSEDRPGNGTLYAVTPYSIMSGHGHDLAALPIRRDALAIKQERLVLNSTRISDPPVAEEHVSRVDDRSALWAGDHYTPIGGIARLGDWILLAAGDRGLLVMPASFASEQEAEVVDVQGAALDVLVEGERAWVLVGEPPALQALSESGGVFSLGTRHALPEAFTRILR